MSSTHSVLNPPRFLVLLMLLVLLVSFCDAATTIAATITPDLGLSCEGIPLEEDLSQQRQVLKVPSHSWSASLHLDLPLPPVLNTSLYSLEAVQVIFRHGERR